MRLRRGHRCGERPACRSATPLNYHSAPRLFWQPPPAIAVRRLTDAVDAVRRGRYVDATDLLPRIDTLDLRAEGEATPAGSSSHDLRGARRFERVLQYSAALPTGSDDLDSVLGRAIVAARHRPCIPSREHRSSVENGGCSDGRRGPLSRLRTLIGLRREPSSLALLGLTELRELALEARAVGAERFAVELEIAIRRSAYR